MGGCGAASETSSRSRPRHVKYRTDVRFMGVESEGGKMIAMLHGQVASIDQSGVVLEVSGVGFDVRMPQT
ncbi:OB-fold domain-containing protein, partial [Bifidobacterium apri]|uniref:OB-fold domain-containing protein n=1 Tax=Bifidobacterium apri TaxID=1769423 RepID=UPI0039913B7D